MAKPSPQKSSTNRRGGWRRRCATPRVPGKYVNPHPRIRRSMVDWLDEPIDRNAERLFDLATEFWGDECLVNFFGTKKA